MGNVEMTKKIPLELLCLLLLEERDWYGYEMAQEIRRRSGGLLSVSVTTLYLALKRLAERGCVSSYYGEAGADSRERARLYYQSEAPAAAERARLWEEYRQAAQGVQNFFTFEKEGGEET